MVVRKLRWRFVTGKTRRRGLLHSSLHLFAAKPLLHPSESGAVRERDVGAGSSRSGRLTRRGRNAEDFDPAERP